MAIPDPSKAGSPFCVLQTDGWNPETPEINNFFIPLFSFRRGSNRPPPGSLAWFGSASCLGLLLLFKWQRQLDKTRHASLAA